MQRAPKQQHGVVMVVALILLSIMAIGAAVMVRGGVLGSRIGGNATAQAQALQMADAALRWCEHQVLTQSTQNFVGTPLVQIQPIDADHTDDPQLWRTEANWNKGTVVASLPASLVSSLPTDGAKFNQPPLCMAEEMALPLRPGGDPNERAFIITARGYSAGYQASTLFGASGAMVKLQSSLRFSSL
jgi:type IV pilus assembly protein PilX